MQYYIKITAFLALTSFAALAKTSPSFDCRKASTEVEKIICTSGPHILGERDSLLGTEFKRAKDSLVGNPKLAADLKTSQIEWADNRKFCVIYINTISNSEKEACLIETYERRIAFLKAIASNTTSLVGNEVQPMNCSRFAIGSQWKTSSLSRENSKKLYGYLSAEADSCWKQLAAYPEQRQNFAQNYIQLASESELGCKEASQRFDEFALAQNLTVYWQYRLDCHLDSNSKLIEDLKKLADSKKSKAEETYQKLQTIQLNSPLRAQIKKEHDFLENIFKTNTFLKILGHVNYYIGNWEKLLKTSQALPHECGDSGGDSGCVKLKVGSVKDQVTVQVHFLLENDDTANVTSIEFVDKTGKIRLLSSGVNELSMINLRPGGADTLGKPSYINKKWTIQSIDCDCNGIRYLVFDSDQDLQPPHNVSWRKYSVDTKNAKLVLSKKICRDEDDIESKCD